VERRTKEINERHAEELAALRRAKAAEDGDSDEGRSGTAGGAGEGGDREAASVADLLAGSSIYGASSGADRVRHPLSIRHHFVIFIDSWRP
jgi:hypothetical protein